MKLTLYWILLATAVLAGCTTGTSSSYLRLERDPVQVDQTHPPALVELNFKSYGQRLNGILYQANGAGPHPTVVLLHGYPGNEKNLDLAQTLRRTGYNVLFFHYRGAWGSEGNFSFMNVVADVGSALAFLRANAKQYRVDAEQLLLVGHSMGGFAALQGAAQDKAVSCVVAIAPANVGLIADLVKSDANAAKSFSAGADALSMLHGWSGEKVLTELENNRDAMSLVDNASRLNGKSVLLIAGDKDTTLSPEVFHNPLVAAYEQQPNIDLTHTVISGDHSFSWSRIQLTTTVMDWIAGCDSAR
ncbi:MAG: alpha/beta hydrolase family protein [Gammaproteobacteria bacterium]